MPQKGHCRRAHRRQNLQCRHRGQASAEYIVVTALVFIAMIGLVWGFPGLSPDPSIVATLKSFFGAYSFALSLP